MASSLRRSASRRRHGRHFSRLIGTGCRRPIFFTVEVLTMTGLVRYVVLFVMKLKTRTVEIGGITTQPDASWMTQVARNLTDADEAFSAAWTISFWTETRSTAAPSGTSCGTMV
jgi:hypothetical protein